MSDVAAVAARVDAGAAATAHATPAANLAPPPAIAVSSSATSHATAVSPRRSRAASGSVPRRRTAPSLVQLCFGAIVLCAAAFVVINGYAAVTLSASAPVAALASATAAATLTPLQLLAAAPPPPVGHAQPLRAFSRQSSGSASADGAAAAQSPLAGARSAHRPALGSTANVASDVAAAAATAAAATAAADDDISSVSPSETSTTVAAVITTASTAIKRSCLNTIQGPHLIADDEGFVCSPMHVDADRVGCCARASLADIQPPARRLFRQPPAANAAATAATAAAAGGAEYTSRRFACDSCNATLHCCRVFEYCVSCCLGRPQIGVDERVGDRIVQRDASANRPPRTADDDDLSALRFRMCTASCRTSSHSVVGQRLYVDQTYRYCYAPH